jgi:hypothetical protein
MRLTILLIIVLQCDISVAQTLREKDLKTEIKEVTVFLASAQIFEAGATSVQQGKTVLRVTNLPPYLDEKSIQVKGEGDFTILSVNHRLNYLTAVTRDRKLDSLTSLAERIESSNARDNARLSVLNEKLSLLNSNKTLGGTDNGVSIAQLRQAIELYETEILKIKEDELRLHAGIKEKKKELERFQKQLKELNDLSILPTSEIEIRISAETAVTARFRVTYLVGNAGWFPKYDVRVKTIKDPLEITYKAEVFQNTGADWKNVKLRFSNGNPTQSGMVPQLNPWNLTFAAYTSYDYSAIYGSRATGVNPGVRNVRGIIFDSNGESIPGVNVLIKGTTIGTVTDGGGNYSLTLPDGASTLVISFIGYQTQEIPVSQAQMNVSLQEDVAHLSEVVVSGYAAGVTRRPVRVRGAASLKADKAAINPLVTTTIENQTTVEIEVAEPYSIKSNGEKMLIDLKKIDAKALYQYYAVPKLDKDAFLVARIAEWDQYNLLEGEANLYFEDAYVGRTILNAKSLEDTLDISLGRDKNIVVGREKNEEFCKRKSIGSNLSETRGFKIMVRNKKSQPVKITITDQIPVSLVSDITVNLEKLDEGKLDQKTGKVTWELDMQPQQQNDLQLHYEVRYPKRQKVILE